MIDTRALAFDKIYRITNSIPTVAGEYASTQFHKEIKNIRLVFSLQWFNTNFTFYSVATAVCVLTVRPLRIS